MGALTAIPQVVDEKAQLKQRKQISRIIKHLRNQLPSKNLASLHPSDELINYLVDYALQGQIIEHSDWHKVIYQTLQQLIQRIDQHPSSHCTDHPAIPNTCTPNALITNYLLRHQQSIKIFALRLLAEIDASSLYFKE